MKYNNEYRSIRAMDNQLYKVLNVKKFIRLKDTRATRRMAMPARTKGLLLLDNPSLKNITVAGDIMIRKDCWEIQIYDSEVAEHTEQIAKQIGAIAFAKA